MTKDKFSLEDNKFLQYTVMIIGIIICAIGINGFLTPAKMLSGGIAGICVILNNLFGINQGISSFLMNIPIFLLARKYFDKRFLNSELYKYVFIFHSIRCNSRFI